MGKENKIVKNQNLGFLGKLDNLLENRRSSLFFIALFGFVLSALLVFQANISIGGDDSFYIMRALKLVQEGKYPSFQGPLYPVFLAPFIALFGIKVPLLKTLSLLLMAGFLFLFYKTYKDRINNTILIIAIFILAFNGQVLYYSSQTYNEAFHLFVQMIFFFQFFRIYEKVKDGDAEIKSQYKDWLLLGLTLFLLTISKNVGLVGILTVSGFFLIQGKWKSLLASIGSFALFSGSYSILKRTFFEAEAQISKQGLMLLYKDPYNFSKGKEDFPGYINRFTVNSSNYLSKHLMKIFNLRDATVTDNIDLIAILLGVILIVGLFISYRKNKFVFFTGAYLTVTLTSIFLALQTRWDQDRLVFLIIPFFCVYILYILDEILRKTRFKFIQPVFIMVVFLYLVSNVLATTKNIDLLKLKKNLSGDKYLGYTPDWQNFLKLSEWSGENLPEGSFVASRKAAMSSIYADGKLFFNVSRVISENPDTLLDHFQNNGVTHVIMAKLRRNPKEKSQFTINTVHRFLSYIEKEYPGTFRPIHQEGQNENEEAVLFEINYNVRANRKNRP